MEAKKWILVENGERVIEILDVLAALIPEEHSRAAQVGEWDEDCFVYEFGGNWYMALPYYPVPDCED